MRGFLSRSLVLLWLFLSLNPSFDLSLSLSLSSLALSLSLSSTWGGAIPALALEFLVSNLAQEDLALLIEERLSQLPHTIVDQ